MKIALQDNSRVLFETRSSVNDKATGGYILIDPSPGYTILNNSKMGELSEEEYDTLMSVARSFNEVKSVDSLPKAISTRGNWEVTPLNDYSEHGDVIQLLVDNGWEVIGSIEGRNVRFKRAGLTYSTSSALFDKDTRVFSCFSTSTSFEPNKGYSPVGVFMMLECENDAGLAYEKLIELGYGITGVDTTNN